MLALQETNQGVDSQLCRKYYTWFYGGVNALPHSKTTHGVGFVIRNDLRHSILAIHPGGERAMALTL